MTNIFLEANLGGVNLLEGIQGVDSEKYHPVSIDERLEIRKRLQLSGCKGKVIVSVGYVTERKRYREVIDALARSREDFLYIIIGKYDPQPDHYIYPRKKEMLDIYYYGLNRLGDKVRFVGEVDNVNEYLQAADCFVHFSRQEGLPNVLLEAMSTGLVAFVSDISGVNGMVTFHLKNSIIIQDPSEILKYLFEIDVGLIDGAQIGTNARNLIECDFSIETTVRNIVDNL